MAVTAGILVVIMAALAPTVTNFAIDAQNRQVTAGRLLTNAEYVDPTSVSASSSGPPDWSFGNADDSVYLPRDGTVSAEKLGAGSILNGNQITGTSVYLSKVNSPRGNITVAEMDSSGNVLTTLGTINATTLNTTPTLTNVIGTATVTTGDIIGLKYEDNASNPTSAYDTPMNVTSGTGTIFLNSGGNLIHCEKVATTNSDLYLKEVNGIVHRITKTGAPTGTMTAGVWNASVNSVTPVFTFGTKDISLLSTTQEDVFFFNTASSYTLQLNDCVGVSYTGGDGTNRLTSVTDAAGPFDGTDSVRGLYTGTWTTSSTIDLRMEVFKITQATASRHGINFDGSNDYVSVGATNIFPEAQDDLTVVAVLEPQVYKTASIISNFRASTDGWGLKLDSTNRPTFEFRSATSAVDRTYTSRYELSLGEMHFLALAYNSTHTRFIIDDQLDNREATGTHTIDTNAAQLLRVGGRQQVSNEYFDGIISELRVYTRQLSDDELRNLRNGVEPSASNLVLHYKFDEGRGRPVEDYALTYHGTLINHDGTNWPQEEFPHYVKVGVDTSRDFDNYDTITDPISGRKITWIFGWANDLTNLSLDTHTYLNHTVIQDLRARGTDTVVLSNIHSAFNGGHAIYTSVVLPWIAEAEANGISVMAASFEDTKYLDATAYPEATLRTEFQNIINAAGPYFDEWTTDIEPENLANYTANKAYYLDRWMDIEIILADVAHDNGKSFASTTSNKDTDIKTLTGYTGGFDDLDDNFIIVMNYQTNATLFESGVSSLVTNTAIPKLFLASLRDVGGSNKLATDDWRDVLVFMSAQNQANATEVVGVGGYAWAHYIEKTDTVWTKPSYLTVKDESGTFRDFQFDLAANVTTTNTDVPQNADDDNTATYWQNGAVQGVGEYFDAVMPIEDTLTKVRITKPSLGAIPATVDVYVDGVLVGNNMVLTQATGEQVLDTTDRVGTNVRIQVVSWGAADTFKLSEIEAESSVIEDWGWSESDDLFMRGFYIVMVMVTIGIIVLIFRAIYS